VAKRKETTRDVLAEHDKFIDSLVEKLDRRVRILTTKAVARTTADLADELKRTNGQIDPVAHNQQVMRRMDRLFMKNLNDLGYRETLKAFTEEFPGNVPLFERTFEAVNRQLKNPLPDPGFGAEDQRFFDSKAISAGKLMHLETDRVAKLAAEQTLVSVGAMPFKQLLERLSATFGKVPTHIEGLAVTTLTTHYRAINDRAYQKIEEEQGEPLRFVYFGPRDKVNRPFCRKILNSNRPRTREEVNALDPSPSPLRPVFTAAGGFNCRHVWIVAGDKEGGGTPQSGAEARARIKAIGKDTDRSIAKVNGQIKRLEDSTADLWEQAYPVTPEARASARASGVLPDLERKVAEASDKLASLHREVNRLRGRTTQRVRDEVLFTVDPAELKHTVPRVKNRATFAQAADDFARLIGRGKLDGQEFSWNVRSRRRAHYSRNAIFMGSRDPKRTVVHELGHWYEERVPGALTKAVEFWTGRTGGEAFERLRDITGNRAYAVKELTKKDKFTHPYMGKVYPQGKSTGLRNTEVVSMGLEHMYAEPVAFAAADPDYFDFIFGLIRGL